MGCAGAPKDDSAAGGTDATDGATDGADGGAVDADGDGLTAADGDCDDSDPAIFPGAPERCNGLDDDCDGAPHPEEGDGGDACAACDESGWWSEARAGETGDALRDRLAAALRGQVCTDYDVARDRLFQVDAEGGTATCAYTGRTFDVSAGVDYDIVNPEHAWPRSDGALEEPEECDLHHLFVTDAAANTRRSNHPFGVVSSVEWSDGGSKLGDDASGLTVFEPRDGAKGDLARAMLYFSLKYEGTLEPADVDKHLDATLFAAWHAADPPDDAEQARSLRLADAQSGRANPLVVCPWLAPALDE
jgi:endonuclease I